MRSLLRPLLPLLLSGASTTCLASCAATHSPTSDEHEIIATVERFFEAMHTRDTELARQTLVAEGVFVSVREVDDKRSVQSLSNAEWLQQLASRKSEVREELVGLPSVLIDGDVAMLWSRYGFEVDGEPSHTGVDAFTLVRTDHGWRITGGVYSVATYDDAGSPYDGDN